MLVLLVVLSLSLFLFVVIIVVVVVLVLVVVSGVVVVVVIVVDFVVVVARWRCCCRFFCRGSFWAGSDIFRWSWASLDVALESLGVSGFPLGAIGKAWGWFGGVIRGCCPPIQALTGPCRGQHHGTKDNQSGLPPPPSPRTSKLQPVLC